jgi:hypothetical protein
MDSYLHLAFNGLEPTRSVESHDARLRLVVQVAIIKESFSSKEKFVISAATCDATRRRSAREDVDRSPAR